MAGNEAGGPLAGFRLVEFEGVGPAPFGVMLLADLGVEVIRIRRRSAGPTAVPIATRGRPAIELDLKLTEDRARAAKLAASADVLVEGFRPGVMERVQLGPEEMCRINPRLIYARMTGWGQSGPLAQAAGHDLNYIGLTGLLDLIKGSQSIPTPPLNILGDYAGGSLYLALGVLAALLERARSGKGQVLDVAIVDGAASLLAPIMAFMAAGMMPEGPQQSLISGAKAYYRCYRCADGKLVSVGPLEPQFREIFARTLGVDLAVLETPEGVAILEDVFSRRNRDEWIEEFDGLDACVAPVLNLQEAQAHPHIVQRTIFQNAEGFVQPAVAPRFSRTPGAIPDVEDGEDRARRWLGELE